MDEGPEDEVPEEPEPFPLPLPLPLPWPLPLPLPLESPLLEDPEDCLLYTPDAADERCRVALPRRRATSRTRLSPHASSAALLSLI